MGHAIKLLLFMFTHRVHPKYTTYLSEGHQNLKSRYLLSKMIITELILRHL